MRYGEQGGGRRVLIKNSEHYEFNVLFAEVTLTRFQLPMPFKSFYKG